MRDFTGFKFKNVDSSDLGIIRVSGGDRYEEFLYPDIEDKTAEIPGLDGSYFFGSNYKAKTIEIEIAFDSLTEGGLRRLKKVFNPKNSGELIFNERPYKKYIAKLENSIELSYVCFEEAVKEEVSFYGVKGLTTVARPTDRKQRIYKGEGKISFICYFPFAKSVYKVLPEEEIDSEWAEASGLLTAEEYQNIDIYNNETHTITIYNGGDLETGFRLYIPGNMVTGGNTLIYRQDGVNETARLVINPITLKDNKLGGTDQGILIDTNNGLILGALTPNNGIITTTGNIYNGQVLAGYFFKFQPNISKILYSTLEIENGYGVEIFYDYLYF